MRAIVLSVVIFVSLGSSGYAQNQSQTLKGVYGPPNSSALGVTPKSTLSPSPSTLSAPNLGAIGNGPRVIVPGSPARGDTLPSDVTPTPINDRPGYGAVTVNGRRAIVDLRTNRIFQYLQ
jgi:hypothetical protein